MLSIIKSIALEGLQGYLVSTQVDVSSGLPNFEIFGLPDITVKESKERIKTAIKNPREVRLYVSIESPRHVQATRPFRRSDYVARL